MSTNKELNGYEKFKKAMEMPQPEKTCRIIHVDFTRGYKLFGMRLTKSPEACIIKATTEKWED